MLRASFANDGAEGESVHMLCTEVERLRAELDAARRLCVRVKAETAAWRKAWRALARANDP